MTNTDAERVSDIVARLRPSFNTDLPVSHAIDKCREEELRNTAAALSRWLVENNALKAEAADKIEAQSKALAEAREYAARLLVSFVTEHCNPVPEWAPLPDLMGVLTQLDNATTITRDMKAALRNALPAYENWMDGHADDVKSATCRQLTFGEIRAAYLLLGDRTPTPENPNG